MIRELRRKITELKIATDLDYYLKIIYNK